LSHRYGVHRLVVGIAHAPAPSQVEGPVKLLPAHAAGAQIVSLPCTYFAHFVASEPSQLVALQASAPPSSHAERLPCGAPPIGVHVPNFVGASHASHCPAHAVSQQTPSTQ
jgi:hypothetical protein